MKHHRYVREERLARNSIAWFILMILIACALVFVVNSAHADCADAVFDAIPSRNCTTDDMRRDTMARDNAAMWRNYEQEQAESRQILNDQLDREEMQRAFDAKLKALEEKMRHE